MRLLFGILVFVLICTQIFAQPLVTPQLLDKLKSQLLLQEQIYDGRWPDYTIDGQWHFRKKVNWLSGFLGGEMWLLSEMTADAKLTERAKNLTKKLGRFSNIDYTHDMGFIFFPTAIKAWQRTGEKQYISSGLAAAGMLARRFNYAGKFIRAWGSLQDEKKAGTMIIDTMMNLELLFWATKESGEYRYKDIAWKHALTTMRESVREDGSSFHVVDFDPYKGNVLAKRTHQGYSDSSTWARGQAWGIYGFTMAYEYTGDERFLATARNMAEYYLQHLPADSIPYWDLTLSEGAVRDASAAAIAACGLLRLADNVSEMKAVENYRRHARNIIRELVRNYLFDRSDREEQGLLLHTVYNFHKDWGVDESFPAGDYFLVEALWRQWQLERQQFIIHENGGRQKLNINKEWFYLEDNATDLAELKSSPATWQKVNLPHTWNQWDVTDNLPGYRRDASWYRKSIFVPDGFANRELVLHFEAANIVSKVYVNGRKAGQHTGGYVGFDVNMTRFIRAGKWNEILVRVDNSYDREIIPSQKSDFFIYGGLCRDVWLLNLPQTHLDRIKIATPQVDANEGQAEITVIHRPAEGKTLQVDLLDPKQQVVSSQKVNVQNGNKTTRISFRVGQPQLWSPDTPQLYTVRAQLIVNDQVVDEISDRFGFRWFEFKEHGPFYLNGERLLLRGTHRHEEHAGLGNALSNAQHRRDMEMIKEMGANFVRLAHYPQDPEIYKDCDELGLLVWDEVPWCRGGVGNARWKQNTKRLLGEMIEQNFNHPSIILWSLGNEVYWLPDFDEGNQVDSLRGYLHELNDLAHELDPSRKTAIRKFYEGAEDVDVFSPSIWSGWYSGVYTSYEKAITKARDTYKRFFHAEYGGASHVGRHTENPVDGKGVITPDEWEEAVNQVKVKNIARTGDWSENYIVDLFDWHLHVSENLDWFTGSAQWAFKDFGTPLRPENAIPYVNQKGLVDRAGKPKDAYYVFKSYWTENPPFCYIESHTWTERVGPEGKARDVNVYSNCEEVELWVNGNNLGRRKRDKKAFPAQGLVWPVQFEYGQNRVHAVGYQNGKYVAKDTLLINYYYSKNTRPREIRLSSERLKNGNYMIEALVVDDRGRRCLDYNKRIYFSVDGSAKLFENYGTPTRSSVIELANGRAVIEMEKVPGERAVIEARNQDFKGSYLELKD